MRSRGGGSAGVRALAPASSRARLGRRGPRARLLAAVAAIARSGALIATAAGAQDDPGGADVPILLDTTVVTATRAPTALRDVPAAISVVDQRAIQEARPTVSLAEPLNRVPGVFVQDAGNQAQGPRIQIRGFGTRAAFGIREIRVLLDGLPETLPDGQTELGDVDLDSIARIEVLRGPASSLYGNASGGVIQLFTEDAPEVPQIDDAHARRLVRPAQDLAEGRGARRRRRAVRAGLVLLDRRLPRSRERVRRQPQREAARRPRRDDARDAS